VDARGDDALVGADAELEAVASCLRHAVDGSEVGVMLAGARPAKRRLGSLDQLDEPGACFRKVVLEHCELPRPEDGAHVPALPPLTPEPSGLVGIAQRLRVLPVLPLRDLPIEPDERPADLGQAVGVLDEPAGAFRAQVMRRGVVAHRPHRGPVGVSGDGF
jgi:hypothetical protein